MVQASAAAASTGSRIPDTTLAINSPTPMSQRVVHYEIEAKYDAAKHSVDATEVLTYHNLTGQALDHFPFHLYQNAFQPKATFVRDSKLMGTATPDTRSGRTKYYGSEDIKSLEVVGQGDLTQNCNSSRPTTAIKMTRPWLICAWPSRLLPAAFVQFKIAFHTNFPETQARSGWKRDFLLGGQWFPKVGVWWHGAWNCHQYHSTTEFFADFGVYDVKLTVPQNEVIGASGVEVSNVNNSDGTKTVTYHGDDIHDFAWTVSPRYKVRESTYQAQMGPIKLRFLMQPAHWSQAERHETDHSRHPGSLREMLRAVSIQDVDRRRSRARIRPPAGMEYPDFHHRRSSWFEPEGARSRSSSWSSTNSGTSTGMAWSRPTNLKMPGWTKASTATPK